MPWWIGLLWGILGGLMLDGMEYVRAIRANKGRLPRSMRTFWTLFGVGLRAAIGGCLSALFVSSGQAETPLAAAVVGIAAPTILEKLSQTIVPLNTKNEPT